jgi:hypothetical protein
MEEATLLSTKGICGDQGDHDDQSPSALINMITFALAGSSGPRICRGVRSPGDGRHREPRQASAVTPNIITIFILIYIDYIYKFYIYSLLSRRIHYLHKSNSLSH